MRVGFEKELDSPGGKKESEMESKDMITQDCADSEGYGEGANVLMKGWTEELKGDN